MLHLLNPLKAAIPNDKAVDMEANLPRQQGRVMKFAYSSGDKPLAGFTIKRGVGLGGFGEVYFAINDAGKEVALKSIQRNLDIEVRGVRQCLNLKHPNLIALYDIQFDDRQQGWIVMEYMSGPSLRDMVERYPSGLPITELRSWFAQIASAVCYLHDHGIVHRDLKPANIFADEGIVKIGDYGLSKFISCSRRGGQTESVGTFHYMAPEIGKGEYGKEIDIYALGIMLYEMATGFVPFDGESSQEIIMKHLTADPDLSRVASPIREVVSKALQKNPTQRFSDVRDMARALDIEIDHRYMAVDRMGNFQQEPPILKNGTPVGSNPAAYTYAKNVEPSPAKGVEPGVGARDAHPKFRDSVTRLSHQEPIAFAVRKVWKQLAHTWQHSQLAPGAKSAILAVIIIVCVMNSHIIVATVVGLGTLYIPYYIVWACVRGFFPGATSTPVKPTVVHHDNSHYQPPVVAQPVVARPGPAVRPPAPPRPLSIKQWKIAKRKQLVLQKTSFKASEMTGSWLGATVVIAVFTSLVAIFQIGSGHAGQNYSIALIWSAVMASICSWIAIALGKRWQSAEGDSAVRSFIQLTLGLGVGGVAYLMSEYLMVPWNEIASSRVGELPVQHWKGFFAPDSTPLLPAYLAYFPLLMGLVHWWKQADPLRRSRFSLLSVLWCVLMGGLVHLIVPFPQPWGVLVFAGTSIAVQLATPWHNPDERLDAPSESLIV